MLELGQKRSKRPVERRREALGVHQRLGIDLLEQVQQRLEHVGYQPRAARVRRHAKRGRDALESIVGRLGPQQAGQLEDVPHRQPASNTRPLEHGGRARTGSSLMIGTSVASSSSCAACAGSLVVPSTHVPEPSSSASKEPAAPDAASTRPRTTCVPTETGAGSVATTSGGPV